MLLKVLAFDGAVIDLILEECKLEESNMIVRGFDNLKSRKTIDKVLHLNFLSETHLLVNNFLELVKNICLEHLRNTFQVDILNALDLTLSNVVDFGKVLKDPVLVKLSELAFDSRLSLLDEVVETLLQHNSVISLKSDSRRPLIDHSRDTRPSRVSSATKRLSNLEHSIKRILGLHSLEARAEVVHNVIHGEIHICYFLLHLMIGFNNLSVGYGVAVDGGQMREQFHLLSLII